MASGGVGGGSIGGGAGATESLDVARIIGDTFLGNVYWSGGSEAVFGKASGAVDQDYLEIHSDKTNHLQVIDSTKDGSGTIRPISLQMGGVEKASIGTDGSISSSGSISSVGHISMSGAGVYFDSADGVAAPVSASGHGRLRYNDTTKTWQQSLDGAGWVELNGLDPTAWHNTGDSFGAAKKLGTLDDFDLVFYRHNVEVGRFTNTGGGFSTVKFKSQLDIPGDNIWQFFNKDTTPLADSSIEFQLGADIATLEMYTLCHNNPPDGDPALDGMVADSVVYGAVNARALGIWTPDACPIWMVTASIQQWYVAAITGGITPFVDAITGGHPQDIGEAATRFYQIYAYDGNFKSRMTIGTAGLAGADGDLWVGLTANASAGLHLYQIDAGSSGLDFEGKTGKNTVFRIISHGGAGSGNSTFIQMVNAEGAIAFVTFPDLGGGTSYLTKPLYLTISQIAGYGMRCNVNATDNSGWEITPAGHMTVYASQIGFFGGGTVGQQTVGAVTNNVTAGGVNGTVADFVDLNTYSVDAPTIRNDIYQLARSVQQLATTVRNLSLAA